MPHSMQLLLFLVLVTLISKSAGALSNRFGQPAVFGEILAGLLLGPSLLNIMGWAIFAHHAEGFVPHPDLAGVVSDLAEIGVILLMFIAGMETDLAEIRRVGRVAFWAALGGVLLPLASGAAVAHMYGYTWSQGWFMGAVLTATSVSISAQTLMELKSLRSKEGSAILGAAVIDDVMGIIVLSLVVAFTAAGAADAGAQAAAGAGPAGTVAAQVGIVCLRMLVYFAAAWWAGRWLLERAAAAVSRLRISEPLMAFVVAVALLYAWGAEHLGGVAAITGSYLAGILFAQTSFRQRIERGIHPLTYSFFVPIFFINIGLRADVTQLGSQAEMTVFVLVVAILGKLVGCGLFAWMAGFDRRESLRVGVGMISRGEVGLIVAGYGLAHGIIGNDIFSAMVLMVLVTTMITPILLRFVFPRGLPEVAAPGIYESVAHVERDEERP